MTAALNAALIGQPGSAARLQTPALVVDLDAFQANLQSLQQHCARSGIELRPHAKTHKCVEIARRQVAGGAIGVCCAKLGEAETMAAGGIASILITSPIVTPGGIERLVRLTRSAAELLVVVDHPDNVQALSAAAQAAGQKLHVLLDLDGGLHRTGVVIGARALELARQIEDAPGLEFRGLQMYAGHLMHVKKFAERRERSLALLAELGELRRSLHAIGIACDIVSGGGTGSFDIDVEAGVLTELQAGSYLFMDRQYNELESRDRGAPAFLTSLFVQTTIISCNTPGSATTDAGLKAFATDAGAPVVEEGAPKDARYAFFGDEYGRLSWTSGEEVRLGSWLRVVPPHCDPTFNLYDVVHVIQDERLVDIWRIDARGRSA
jgi:D-serine deaminase-like pyridoxal phosphate-dependent protein